MTHALVALFCACAGAVLMTYAGYPLLLALLGKVRPRPHTVDEGHEPAVTMIVCAYNEGAVMARKLENALALEYPADALEILVVSDASTDDTDAVVTGFAARGVRLLRQEPRGGKSQALTRFIPEARGSILVFSDANSMYEPDAVRKLVRHFADDDIGYVVGLQRYGGAAARAPAGQSEGLYWRYETLLKRLESRIGSVVGGDGAIYALRAQLFQPLRHDDISDFVNPLQVVARGYRGVYDDEAVCIEDPAPDFPAEFRRKVRIVNRSLRGLLRVPAALNPFRVGLFALQIGIHKLLRWFVPFFLLGAFAANAALVGQRAGAFYDLALVLQAAFYGLATLRAVPGVRRARPVYVAYYFCMVNLAAAMGVLTCLAGRRYVTWRPER